MNQFADLLYEAHPLPAKLRPSSKYDPKGFADDPAEYFVPAPERGGARISGCTVDREIEVRLRELLDRGHYHFRTVSDIVRTAVCHFVLSVVVPAQDVSMDQYRALARVYRRHAALMGAEQDDKLLRTAESDWGRAEALHREDLKSEVLSDLRSYADALLREDRRKTVWHLFLSSPVLGQQLREHVKGRRESQAREGGRRASVVRGEPDEALDALAEEV